MRLEEEFEVLMASRNKGAQQKSGHKAIGFISQIFGSKTHQKSKQNVGKMK
jgi:hypothetical protein